MRSEHPLGKAIVRCQRQQQPEQTLPETTNFQMIPGRGVFVQIAGQRVQAGSREWLQELQISMPSEVQEAAAHYLMNGCSITYLVIEQNLVGFLALADTLRADAAPTIGAIKETGVTPVLLTGDHENAAQHIAAQIQIDEVHANCLPEDKLNWIEYYQKQQQQVCMVGDGINDAPALKKAYVGIAMGGIGSDIAIDAADIALVNDEIKELPHLLRLAKRMMTVIHCNLAFSMILNLIAIILAIDGILNPVVGALVHNAGSVLVIINSAFLLKWRIKK